MNSKSKWNHRFWTLLQFVINTFWCRTCRLLNWCPKMASHYHYNSVIHSEYNEEKSYNLWKYHLILNSFSWISYKYIDTKTFKNSSKFMMRIENCYCNLTFGSSKRWYFQNGWALMCTSSSIDVDLWEAKLLYFVNSLRSKGLIWLLSCLQDVVVWYIPALQNSPAINWYYKIWNI